MVALGFGLKHISTENGPFHWFEEVTKHKIIFCMKAKIGKLIPFYSALHQVPILLVCVKICPKIRRSFLNCVSEEIESIISCCLNFS